MTIIYLILLIVYAVLMVWATIEAWSSVPGWLGGLTLVSAVLLLAGIWVTWLVPIGLALLLGAAVTNGRVLYGKIHFSHLVIRLILSLIILGLWWFVTIKS